MQTATDIESRTQEIGREILARARSHTGRFRIDRADWWEDRLMRWSMREPRVKAQLFRLIDCLPALRTPAQVNQHLREYLGEVADKLDRPLRAALAVLPEDGRMGRISASLARRAAMQMARRFIAGSNLDEVIATIKRLRERGMECTIDPLGEAVLSEAEAHGYQQQYLRIIDALCAATPNVNVSIKLSSLYSQIDPADPAGSERAAGERLRPILRLAKARGAFVNFDMEQYALKDLTLSIFRQVLGEWEFRDWPDVGIAMQAYLRDTEGDIIDLAHWAEVRGTPVWVRLVKGAYWDYETVVAGQQHWPLPVFARKDETDASFERCTRLLIENRQLLRPAIASHNVRSIAHSLAAAEAHDLPRGAMEVQMLYGMADPLKAALAEMGQRVRVYAPFGELLPGMAYLVRRLLENTSNEGFLRAGMGRNSDEEMLLMSPALNHRGTEARRGWEKCGTGVPPVDRDHGRGAHATTFVNEPLSDFSEAAARIRMEEALAGAGQELGSEYPLVIAGRPVRTGRFIESLNPAHIRQIVGRCACATPAELDAAIAGAAGAFPGWRDLGPENRAAHLQRTAAVLRRRRFELAAWEVFETAKQRREADADVAEAIDYCEFYAAEMLRLVAPQRRDVPGEENVTFYEPRGVAVVIAPWNFPLAILCGMTAAALVTGNTVIMKPAEQSPVIAAKLMEVFQEAGLPPGVVNYLPGVGEEIGPLLVSHRDVSIVAFTGSRNVGLSIGRQAAETPPGQEHIKRVLTEMGGKNAIIVDEDADFDEAIRGVIASAFGYAGQKCSACSRVIVLESVYQQFLERLVEATASIRIGPAEDPGTFMGPLIDEEARRRVLNYIEAGKREATLAYAGDVGALASDGFYVGPHIFADVPPSATIAREEIFGPVLSVIRANDLTEALTIANGASYALTGGVYSRSPATIERVRREFRVGNLYINRKITGALVDRQPFGGFKLSGTGPKAGGQDYLQHFMFTRTITENTMRRGFAPEAG